MHKVDDNMLEVIKWNQGIQLELGQNILPFEWYNILKGSSSYLSPNSWDIKSQGIMSTSEVTE